MENQKQIVLNRKVQRFLESIRYMQRRILSKFVTRESKLDVLKFCWDQTLCHMLERNKVLKDVKLSRFIYMVNKLTVPEVKTRILELYLEKCKLIGFIAFS